ncbi:GspH/FimT family pseudopilin [Pseudomonas sp. MT3]|nr:GspH/FimT family pseudopilin [uncultured Pseudomonas sp.]
MSRPKGLAGFTLIELMIVVTLLAVFATIALPSFTSTIENNRVQSASEELFSLLQYARSEAVSRNAPVTVAPASSTSDDTDPDSDASTRDREWAGNVQVTLADTTLRELGDAGLGPTIAAENTLDSIVFSAAGASGSKGCLSICSAKDDGTACRYIGLQPTGRLLPPSSTKPGECQ